MKFTQMSESQETEQKTSDDLIMKKGERQTLGLLAPPLKWEKELSASTPRIPTNLTNWKFDLHIGLHSDVCKRNSCQDPGSESPVVFCRTMFFD